MKRIYIVTFETHKDCKINYYVYHCQAQNAKEACELAKHGGFYGITECKANVKLWGHMFHVHAVKSRVQDIDKLTVRTWNGNTFTGDQVMNAYIKTDFKVWRINGRNLYA